MNKAIFSIPKECSNYFGWGCETRGIVSQNNLFYERIALVTVALFLALAIGYQLYNCVACRKQKTVKPEQIAGLRLHVDHQALGIKS